VYCEGIGVKAPLLSVGGCSEVPLNVDETDLSKLDASIVAPSGKEDPCQLKRLDNGQTGETCGGVVYGLAGGVIGGSRIF